MLKHELTLHGIFSALSPKHIVVSSLLVIDFWKGAEPGKGSLHLGAEILPILPIPVKACPHIGHVTPFPPYTNTLVWVSILLCVEQRT